MTDRICMHCGIEYDPEIERDILNIGKCVRCRVQQAQDECRRMTIIWTPGLQEAYR